MQFLRRHGVRIVIGTILMAVLYGAIGIWMPYRREQQIGRRIQSLHGHAEFLYFGPDWIPYWIQDRVSFFDRIHFVCGLHEALPNDVLLELGSLKNLDELCLDHTQITDADLDALKGLTALKRLHLNHTKTTPEGRASFQKALPGCKITPEP